MKAIVITFKILIMPLLLLGILVIALVLLVLGGIAMTLALGAYQIKLRLTDIPHSIRYRMVEEAEGKCETISRNILQYLIITISKLLTFYGLKTDIFK